MLGKILCLPYYIKMMPGDIKKIIWLAKDENTYYPMEKRKSYWQKLLDLFLWYIKYQDVNFYYYLYGFDLFGEKEVIQGEYQDYIHFMRMRNRANLLGNKINCQIVILRDKYLFYKYMNSIIPVPDVFAVFMEGQLYDRNMQKLDIQSLSEKKNYFIKDIDGECASFIKRIHDFDELQGVLKTLNGKYIFQEAVAQCEKMNTINPYSINTLRIVTIRNKRKPEPYVLTSLLRVGTKATGTVDNWAAGGVAIGIQPTGYLASSGFYKPGHGKKVEIHPDTGICFNQFQVPCFEEAMKLACRAHQLFYNINSIGWDIAITDHGPVFIEGNDNWEISLMQACDRGLKKEWEEAVT